MSTPRSQKEMLKEIAAEFKALSPEEKKARLTEAEDSEWGRTFKSLEQAGYELAFIPPDPKIEEARVLDAVFGRLTAMTPEQFKAELAKYKDDPTAKTLRMLNDPEGFFNVPDNNPSIANSTEENHHGQENPKTG